MPMVPVYKLETLQDLDEMAENGGWESHKEMCATIGLKPQELLSTYQNCDGAYEFEGEGEDVGDGKIITWFGRDHTIVQDTYPLYTDKNSNLFAWICDTDGEIEERRGRDEG